uniref:Uncharacterized protein n=1 Tax=Plectus sambesii TaxID=2011161 RepID=A0A914VS36_9BILA
MLPPWWPYSVPPKELVKRAGILGLGVLIGSNIILRYYEPLKGFDEELEEGKYQLVKKYEKIRQEREAAGANQR